MECPRKGYRIFVTSGCLSDIWASLTMAANRVRSARSASTAPIVPGWRSVHTPLPATTGPTQIAQAGRRSTPSQRRYFLCSAQNRWRRLKERTIVLLKDLHLFLTEPTANDVSQLPPEMLRKGRWDDLFFVDLPNQKEREAILKIQIQKYGRNPKDYDLQQLAKGYGWITASKKVFIHPTLVGTHSTASHLLPLSEQFLSAL
jgi:hypothetical protein